MPNFSGSGGKRSSARKRTGVGTIRRSQIITTFGPGAILELPDYTVVLNSAANWYTGFDESDFVLHEPNLEKLLGVKYFREPPSQEKYGPALPMDISATRFPYMHFCPRCGDLKRYSDFQEGGRKCKNGHAPTHIIPSRFIAICEDGHLMDFPYRWWVHHGRAEECTGSGYNLRLEFSDDTEGLDGIRVTCKDCGATKTMSGALGCNALKGYRCNGSRPWVYDSVDVECNKPLYGALRTASNVYFPVTESALTIPPWSTNLQQYLSKIWDKIEPLCSLNFPEDEIMKVAYQQCCEVAPPNETFTKEDVRKALQLRMHRSDNYDVPMLRCDEYKVLSSETYPNIEDMHFHTQIGEVPDIFRKHITEIVLVKRLREVLALKGFSRVSPGGVLQKPGNPNSEWLPAVEMLGEGIFVRLNEEAVQAWTRRIAPRYDSMEKRINASEEIIGMPTEFSPRFVLLHTLAHLLIRQLALESGYSAASIKERLYSSDSPGQPMAGILLYTASSDADGSLGGLVRHGQRDRFEHSLQSALDEAVWCAADPVCMEQKAQGVEGLNYAACHSCTLLPETSCEVRNCLLDRVAVIGSSQDRSIGFFGSFVSF